jgi:pimeloyl-ACP methyl ester carboxylesterase
MVTKLILADTGAGSECPADWVATVHAFADTLEPRGIEAFADMVSATPLLARYIAQGPAAERFIRSCLMTHRAHGLAHTAREILARRPTIYALESRLRQLRVPTLRLVGERDEPCVKVHGFMANCLEESKHIVVQDAGHLTNLEAPTAFNTAVNRCLARS